MVVESSINLADDALQSATSPTEERVARILDDAASYRRARSPAKAVEALRRGLELVPRSIEVHEMLRDVLVESNRGHEAVGYMVALAGLRIEALDAEGATRTLQEALAIDPHEPRALQMLRSLGFEVVEDAASASNGAREFSAGLSAVGREESSYDPEAPLPSYDLEDTGPADVPRRPYSEPNVRPGAPIQTAAAWRGLVDEIDDPFQDGPLPSFPLPDSETALEEARGGVPELEAALEEAEFFASRGLCDDARAILEEQIARLPNHPLVLERLAEVEAQQRAMESESGTRPSPAADLVEDRAFDIAESLGAIDGANRSLGVGPEPGMSGTAEQVDVEEVFAKFKEGVAKQIGVDDAQSHYDLGVAYKEMALLDDAMREFETAARDTRRACVCHSMIGTIQLERGNINEAIEAFMRGLQAPDRTKEQEASLSYEVGAAYEAKRMNKQALDYFQRAARLVPAFRDVQERLRRLQRVEPKPQVRAVAVGSDDEFDRAFNDILSGGKLP